MSEEKQLRKVWDDFCERMCVLKNGKQLFKMGDDLVEKKGYGPQERQVLVRHKDMEDFVASVAEAVQKDQESQGLIYILFRKGKRRRVEPLYIGIAQRWGREGGDNANIASVKPRKDESSDVYGSAVFCRWGYGADHHIGALSAAVLGGKDNQKKAKYEQWAEKLFETGGRLKNGLFLWMTKWPTNVAKGKGQSSRRFEDLSLVVLEQVLIGIAAAFMREELLNVPAPHNKKCL